MASVTFYLKNGQTRNFSNCRVSGPKDKNDKWMGMYFVWPLGRHIQGTQPLFSISVDELFSKKKDGRKGIDIRKY